MTTITVKEEVLTPSIMQSWLDNLHPRQRTVSKEVVANYVADIKSGKWIDEVQDKFILDTESRLVQGMHRCRAAVEANYTMRATVVRNVPESVIHLVDNGRTRTIANHVHIGTGLPNSGAIASLARLLINWERGKRGRALYSSSVRTSVLVEFVHEHHELLDIVRFADRVRHGVMNGATSVFALPMALFMDIDSAAAEDFFEKMATGADIKSGSPLHALRERILRERIATTKTNDYELIAYIIKAWNAERTGKTIRVFKLADGETYPEPI